MLVSGKTQLKAKNGRGRSRKSRNRRTSGKGNSSFKKYSKSILRNTAKQDQQRPTTKAPNRTPVTNAQTIITAIPEPELLDSSNSRMRTLDEANWQQCNDDERASSKLVLQVQQAAAEKGKESARLWEDQMKAGRVNLSNAGTG